MGSIIVLLELAAAEGPGPGPEDGEPAVLLVHAAGADPDVPEDPQRQTLCQKDTEPMEHSHYSPSRPGDPWYPPKYYDRRCRECETVLRSI